MGTMKKTTRPTKSGTSSPRTDSIEAILEDRGSEYGPFISQATIVQELKFIMRHTKNWEHLPSDMKEGLEMVQHKIGRILNGNSENLDSWEDCIGYLTLVVKRLKVVNA